MTGIKMVSVPGRANIQSHRPEVGPLQITPALSRTVERGGLRVMTQDRWRGLQLDGRAPPAHLAEFGSGAVPVIGGIVPQLNTVGHAPFRKMEGPGHKPFGPVLSVFG